MKIHERIAKAVADWPHWSRAERRDGLVKATEEIIEHCKSGTGNAFIREWCNRNLKGTK